MTSTIKVNNIQNQCGANIINESSNTITIGASGDTISLASGASQTGFGRTGTVDWQTTKKTADFTAVNGEGYFIDTSGGAVTITLPASPSAGDIVAFKDYSGTFSSNNLTVGRNGSNLDGTGANKILNTDNLSMSLVYVDATQGWKSVEEGTGFLGETFIAATGGTITTSGNCKIHTFTSPGNFCVSQIATNAANNVVSYVVVAGGGGGGRAGGGGGGAGGFREVKSPVTPYTASPLDGYPSSPNRITVTATSFPITIGGGGAGSPHPGGAKGANGSVSTFSTITSAGGGVGGVQSPTSPNHDGGDGGSGGGGAVFSGPGGTGNTPSVTPAQGKDGGNGGSSPGATAGGGGGATVAGAAGSPTSTAGPGGAGATTSINASPTTFAGGGGGGSDAPGVPGGNPGPGGGGQGGTRPDNNSTSGTANTGGGAGGLGEAATAGRVTNGGSGIVIIRYKFQ